MHILLSLLALLAPVPELTEAELATALGGQVAVRIEHFARTDGKAAGRGVGAIVVERPAAEVYATLARFEDKAEYVPRLKSITVLEQSPERVLARLVADASVTTARYTMAFRLDEPGRVVSWKLDKAAPDNSIADAEGEYRVHEITPARSLVTYRSYVDTRPLDPALHPGLHRAEVDPE